MANPQEQPLLSIIIPAYNEQERLPASLEKVATFVAEQPYGIELIIVNNNSRDATQQIAEQFAHEHNYTRVMVQPVQGKGAAVRLGMLAAIGDYLFICDADLSMPIEEVNKFLPPQLENYDVAIGSREGPGSRRIDEPEYRHLMGRVFNFIVRVLAVPNIQDTQCGFKSFTREAAHDVFSRQTIDGFGFDVEILYIALKQGYTVKEVPITWYHIPGSKVNPIRDTINMFNEVLRVRLNGRRGVYNKRRYEPEVEPTAYEKPTTS